MDKTYCHSLKDQLLSFIGSEVSMRESRDGCTLVLPTKTVDDRFVTVFVDRKTKDYFLVHDGGKTAVHITDLRAEHFSQMAERLGATFADGIFQTGCDERNLSAAVLAVGQCESMGMWHLLGHKPDLAEESVNARIERGIGRWQAPYPFKLERKVRIKGTSALHLFDFVSYPQIENHKPIAIKVLRPSVDPAGKAREYGFLAYDTKASQFEDWRRLAILTKADQWSTNAKNLIAEFSAATLQIDTGEEASIEERLPATLTSIAA